MGLDGLLDERLSAALGQALPHHVPLPAVSH